MNNLLSDTVGWAAVVGLFLPWVTAVLQQPGWAPNTKRVVAIAVAIAAGIGTCLGNGTLGDGSTVLQTIAIVIVAAQGVYAGLLRQSAKAIENNVLAFNQKPRGRYSEYDRHAA